MSKILIKTFIIEIATVNYEADKDVQAKKREILEAETLPFYLEKLDALAKENNGHFALGKVSNNLEEIMNKLILI